MHFSAWNFFQAGCGSERVKTMVPPERCFVSGSYYAVFNLTTRHRTLSLPICTTLFNWTGLLVKVKPGLICVLDNGLASEDTSCFDRIPRRIDA